MDNSFLANNLEYDLFLDKKFDTVFDLSCVLEDLQSILNGFTYLTNTDRLYSSNELETPKKISNYILNDIKYKELSSHYNEDISYVAEDDSSNEYTDKHLKNNTITDSKAVMIKNKISNQVATKEYFPRTTARSFAKRYKHTLKLKSFKSGSLLLSISSSVISSLIVEFLKRIFTTDFDNKQILNITYVNNLVAIQINDPLINNDLIKKHLTIDGKKIDNLNYLNLNTYIDEIFSHVSIQPRNYEKNISSFLDILSKNELISVDYSYNQKGIRTIANDVKRFSGLFLDSYN